MKRILALLLCLVALLATVACGSEEPASESNNDLPPLEDVEKEPAIKYYPGTDIPTVDSVLDVSLVEEDDDVLIYGTFENADYTKIGMLEYAKYLKENCGFEYENSSYKSSMLNVYTDAGTMIIMGTELTDVGYVIAIGLPE